MLYGRRIADAGPVNAINKVIHNKNWDWCLENFVSLQEFQHKSICVNECSAKMLWKGLKEKDEREI